jgi:lantibiotic modifying enzyme
MVVHACNPALRQRQEDVKFEANLGYMVRTYLKTKTKKQGKNYNKWLVTKIHTAWHQWLTPIILAT